MLAICVNNVHEYSHTFNSPTFTPFHVFFKTEYSRYTVVKAQGYKLHFYHLFHNSYEPYFSPLSGIEIYCKARLVQSFNHVLLQHHAPSPIVVRKLLATGNVQTSGLKNIQLFFPTDKIFV